MITTGVRIIEGDDFIQENALPIFRSRAHERLLDDRFLLDDEKPGYGYETGDRVLPYKWQDVYSRRRDKVEIRTIIMENDHVRAEFWPDYGMRLYSLFQKDDGRELLFCNPVLQFGNLAIRRAWFSGGIEWNFGQLGHSFTTCAPVFVARLEDEDGNGFLRAYEYERQKGLYWHLDFHLDDDDRNLWVYGRFINPHDDDRPFYWWTNIAVREEEGMRIFSGGDDVIFIDSSSLMSESAKRVMAHGRLPHLGIREGVDYTYPENFTDYSNEYFFQNRHREDESWEAAAWKDGWVFFDRADRGLAYHKMFCWGGEAGGRHWRDYLSREGEGAYVELQAGFTRTQVHGMDIAARSSIDFVQTFGGFQCQAGFADGDYGDKRTLLYRRMDALVGEDEIRRRKAEYASYSTLMPSCLLNTGSGYGALETIRRPSLVPSGLFFPLDSIGDEERVWLDVLKGRPLPDGDIPSSYMVDCGWRPMIEAVAGDNPNAWNILGVMDLENENDQSARRCFEKALSIRRNAFSLRCLAVMAIQQGRMDEAVGLMGECIALDGRREYAEEYIALLVSCGRHQEAWDCYQRLYDAVKADERLIIDLLPAACRLGRLEFLEECYNHEFAVIREGERNYTESWYWYHAMKKAEEDGVPFSEDMVGQCMDSVTIPPQYDFRLG